MNNRHDVRFWEKRKRGGRRRPWEVRWTVGDRPFSRSFLTAPLADKYRGDLVKAAADPAEVFSTVTGEPESWAREVVSFYSLARDAAGRRWKGSAAGNRRTVGQGLAVCVLATLDPRKANRARPDDKLLRRALQQWAFIPPRWDDTPPEDVAAALDWIAAASRPVSALEDAEILDQVLDAIGTRPDGQPYAPWTYRRYRGVLYSTLTLAKTRKLIGANPLDGRAPERRKVNHAVDPRAVPSLGQARALLAAVKDQGPRGAHLYAFFATMYYAGCRPAEVIGLRDTDLTLPAHGWGQLTLSGGCPDIGADGGRYTDDGKRHDPRGLKARAENELRIVPIPPDLVRILRDHTNTYPLAADGRLFSLDDGSPITGQVYRRVWKAARGAALTEREAASKLAARPYDLRHGNASLLLGLRIAPTEVARRLGHSVQMLYAVYAHWLQDQAEAANALIERALAAEDPQVTHITGHGPDTGQPPETRAA